METTHQNRDGRLVQIVTPERLRAILRAQAMTTDTTFEARAFGLCSSIGATAEEARGRCERKARKMMRGMKISGQLPQISVAPSRRTR